MRSRPKGRTVNKLKRSAASASSLARRPNARDLSLHRVERRCRRAERPGVAHSRSRAEFGLNRDGSVTTGTSILLDETLRQLSSLLVPQAPKLKAFCVDCFLDRIAREVVGRSFVRRYCPGSGPGTVLARKFVHIRVAGEGAQPVRSLRFKNVDAHDALYLTLPRCTELRWSPITQLIPARDN